MIVNNYGLLIGLDSFVEVHVLFDYLSWETQPRMTRHHDVSALYGDILREPNDEVLA